MSPESSASAGRPEAWAPARALMSAFSIKVCPVSSGASSWSAGPGEGKVGKQASEFLDFAVIMGREQQRRSHWAQRVFWKLRVALAPLQILHGELKAKRFPIGEARGREVVDGPGLAHLLEGERDRLS